MCIYIIYYIVFLSRDRGGGGGGSHKRVITFQNPCNLSPFITFGNKISKHRYIYIILFMYKNSCRPVTKIALSLTGAGARYPPPPP